MKMLVIVLVLIIIENCFSRFYYHVTKFLGGPQVQFIEKGKL